MRLVFVYNDKNTPRKFYGIICSPVVTKERAASLLTNLFKGCPNASAERTERFVTALVHDDKKWIYCYDHKDGGRPFFAMDCDGCMRENLADFVNPEEVMGQMERDPDNWLEFDITKEIDNA